MTRVTLDATTIAKLVSIPSADPSAEVELCDESGNVVGWYAPARSDVSMQEVVQACPISEEEIQRRLREEGRLGRTWAEIRRDLESK
jgi:hypothetical protein